MIQFWETTFTFLVWSTATISICKQLGQWLFPLLILYCISAVQMPYIFIQKGHICCTTHHPSSQFSATMAVALVPFLFEMLLQAGWKHVDCQKMEKWLTFQNQRISTEKDLSNRLQKTLERAGLCRKKDYCISNNNVSARGLLFMEQKFGLDKIRTNSFPFLELM